MTTRYQSKLQQLEDLKNELKEEKIRVEQSIGKLFLKEFGLGHEDQERIEKLIKDLGTEYQLNEEEKEEVREHVGQN